MFYSHDYIISNWQYVLGHANGMCHLHLTQNIPNTIIRNAGPGIIIIHVTLTHCFNVCVTLSMPLQQKKTWTGKSSMIACLIYFVTNALLQAIVKKVTVLVLFQGNR